MIQWCSTRNKKTLTGEPARENRTSALHLEDRKSRLPTGIPWKIPERSLCLALYCICHPGRKQLQQTASVIFPFPQEETSCHQRCPGRAKRQWHERLTPTSASTMQRDRCKVWWSHGQRWDTVYKHYKTSVSVLVYNERTCHTLFPHKDQCRWHNTAVLQ